MRRLLTVAAIAVAVSASGCKRIVVRNADVYKAELDQYHSWSTTQAAHLRSFIVSHCECDSGPEGDPYKTAECEDAANLVLVIEARAEWHKALAEYNAGLTDKEPPKQPPAIPALTCPLSEED